jgi:hypothetical protein
MYQAVYKYFTYIKSLIFKEISSSNSYCIHKEMKALRF